MDIRVVADPAAEVGRLLARTGAEHVALSGGSSPAAAYELAARLRPDWSGVHLWWSDERCVPPDDPRSNYRLARETLLDALSRPPRAHRVHGELDPDEAAARLDDELRGVTLGLALLGLGPDGHTASLFPNAPTLREADRRAVAAAPGLEPLVPRVTMTLPVLNAAALVVFLAQGERKAEAVALAFAGEPDEATPASLVRGAETVLVVDEPAASRLQPTR